MSQFSGEYDLADHIGGQGGWFDKNGNPAKMGSGTSPLYSDEMLDFIAFKKRTGGVIHQHKKIKVSEWNQKDVEAHCPAFKVFEHTRKLPDKRTKSGFREETYYTYEYYGKEYKNLKELNKKNVYVTIDITFDTLLDILPYYPYTISFCSCNEDTETVFISNLPGPLKDMEDSYESGGFLNNSWPWYQKKLQEHTQEVILRYFNPEGREVIEEVEFKPFEDKYIGYLSNDADTNFRATWVFDDGNRVNFWTSPKIVEGDRTNVVEMSKYDYENFIGHKAKIKYVKAMKHELHLG